MEHPLILAIESSCDDTSAAVLAGRKVMSNVIASQLSHRLYGGVVPEVASREHQEKIVAVVAQALETAGVDRRQIEAVAFTRGPGLAGSLMVGTSFAKAFALARRLPLIEVNHMQAHVAAHLIDPPFPEFPFLCLTVSGGHTQIVLVHSPVSMEILGETVDDAAGEAFDKTGKLLGLPYPAGPEIDKLARQGNPVYSFPIPDMPGYQFSFSGLKTAILYFLQRQQELDPQFAEKNKADICASVQHTIIRILLKKLQLAARETGIRHIGIAGGVAANSGLRTTLQELGREQGWQVYIPQFQYCTDNAAMIGIAAYFKYLRADFVLQDVSPDARMSF